MTDGRGRGDLSSRSRAIVEPRKPEKSACLIESLTGFPAMRRMPRTRRHVNVRAWKEVGSDRRVINQSPNPARLRDKCEESDAIARRLDKHF